MSNKRMFTNKITDSSSFLEMPSSTQLLYFHLNMAADDDGFCNQTDLCIFKAHASKDDLNVLMAKRFILPFDKGIIVIKHWRMHNLLRKDRYHESQYTKEKSMLYLKENGAYTFDETKGTKLLELSNKPIENQEWQPNGNQMATENRLGKDRLDKISIDKNSIDKINKEKNNIENNKKSLKPKIEQALELTKQGEHITASFFTSFEEYLEFVEERDRLHIEDES